MKGTIVATATKPETQTAPDGASWINGLSSIMQLSDNRPKSDLRTIVSSDVKNGKLALFVPPEMSELQPDNLRYLHAMASRNGCMLIEDRRTSDIRPLVEQRDLKPHKMISGISELLKMTGMPGPDPTLSQPHRLKPDNQHIPVTLLIDMVSASVKSSKKVVLLPTPAMVKSTGNETHPISAYACKLVLEDQDVTLSYFDSPGFKAIGYVADTQFVMHVFIGGGPLRSPHIWANTDAMLKNRFRFQLFRSKQPGQDFGLLYNTFYLDIEGNQAGGAQNADQGQLKA